jgi:hypothetical protein
MIANKNTQKFFVDFFLSGLKWDGTFCYPSRNGMESCFSLKALNGLGRVKIEQQPLPKHLIGIPYL